MNKFLFYSAATLGTITSACTVIISIPLIIDAVNDIRTRIKIAKARRSK